MFDYFKGYVSDKRKTSKGAFVTVDVSGIGYLLEVTERDFLNIQVNEENLQKLYVLLIHREDVMTLYGFLNKETRDIFQILISVSGVGAKMALALLNEFDACDVISLVIEGDFKELTRAKGVGPKLAQKIILELKDKMSVDPSESLIASIENVPTESGAIDVNQDAVSALMTFGLSKTEAVQAVKRVQKDGMSVEQIIFKALQQG